MAQTTAAGRERAGVGGQEQRRDERGGWTVHVPAGPVPRVPVTGVPGQVLWWGGLAAVAALGVVEWPVAATVAAGTYLAERRARAEQQRRPS